MDLLDMSSLEYDDVSLEGITYQILGQRYFTAFYNYFKFFFTDIADFNDKKNESEKNAAGTEKTYVAFITRRCSCLAYVFWKILGKENRNFGKNSDINLESMSGVWYLTDSALINKGREIGRMLLEGNEHLPKIMLVDDAVSYGRTITGIMEQFEKQVMKCIEAEPDQSLRKKAKQRFGKYRQQSIAIYVYAEKKQMNLLKPQDSEILRSKISLPHYQWNDLSNRISELMININTANTAVVFSQGIKTAAVSPDQWKPNGWIKVNWEYRGHHDVIFYYPISISGEGYQCICSVRCIECSVIDDYRLIPAVFLPPMTEKQLEKLEKRIFEKLKNGALGGVSCKKYAGYDTFEEWKEKELRHLTLQSRFDFVTMYFSCCTLKIFEKEAGIEFSAGKNYDSEKILWNYSDNDMRYQAAKRFISDRETDILLSKQEIRDILGNLSVENTVFDLLSKSENTETGITSKADRESINRSLENHLFELGMKSEKHAYEALFSESKLGQYTLKSLQNCKYYSFDTFFKDLYRRIRKDKRNDYSWYEILSSILQMEDAGMLSIVSSCAETKAGIIKPEVKICEQAPSAMICRYLDHIDILAAAEQKKSIPMIPFFRRYCNRVKAIDSKGRYEEDSFYMAKNMRSCITLLSKAGQKLVYWNAGLKRHYIIDKRNGGIHLYQDGSDILRQRKLCRDIFDGMKYEGN